MNNTEATTALTTKYDEIVLMLQNIQQTQAHLLEYEIEMGNWKTDVVNAKIAVIKSEATVVGVNLSAWDGSAA